MWGWEASATGSQVAHVQKGVSANNDMYSIRKSGVGIKIHESIYQFWKVFYSLIFR